MITDTNAKNILHASLTLAAKFYLDKYEKKTIFYAIGGISKQLMNKILHSYLELI